MPDLIGIQRGSYDAFLQRDVPHEKRTNTGLQAIFNSVFPIRDSGRRTELRFEGYELEEPKYDVEECQQRGLTYAAPLRVKLNLLIFQERDSGASSREPTLLEMRDGGAEGGVYLGDMPLMTDNGVFIINGTERVVVSQLHRSPGVFFDHDRGKSHSSGKVLYSARVIPYRGSWLDFEFDARDILHVRIDRRRKLPATTLLYALEGEESEAARARRRKSGGARDPREGSGMTRQEILSCFYGSETLRRAPDGASWRVPYDPSRHHGARLAADLVDADTGEAAARAGDKLSERRARALLDGGLRFVLAPPEHLVGRWLARGYEFRVEGEEKPTVHPAGTKVDDAVAESLKAAGIDEVEVLDIDNVNVSDTICLTLNHDKNTGREGALRDIYRLIRPGDNPTPESAEAMLRSMFFDEERYDLSPVGRVRLNSRVKGILRDEASGGAFDTSDELRVLRKEDIIAIMRSLCRLKDGHDRVDDIDHLGNRRVRSVGELLENQYRVGLQRMERAIRERINAIIGSNELQRVMPKDLINAKPVAGTVREFFSSSQLSQFMDQTNPLAEITHKRRLSALGPGGLTRERAGFEVRDVHPTHYGRICPIETPEGPNIGLINSLATYARINRYGFIESPCMPVRDGRVSGEPEYLSALDEESHTIAQANEPVDSEGRLEAEVVSCRRGGAYITASPGEIDYIDVSPKQVVSVAAALIPFLENDDANRALMGSNMQRQAVPLLRAQAPLVGTGMEASVARDSGATIVARRGGRVRQVDASRVVVRARQTRGGAEDSGVDIYNLRKFQRSNQSTCINQRPTVSVGDEIEEGDIVADGAATHRGELALGRNVLCAFMTWQGYNFEDSILISESVVRDDAFTSIHIEEFETKAQDTKLGPEEITRDIPNVGDESLGNLDETGIVYVGAEVHAGDILVGKVTPKGESPTTPEEKLLRAIFGEKAAETRDSSLRAPPGMIGTVVDVRVFSRRGVDKDERTLAIEQAEKARLQKDRDDERAILEDGFLDRLRNLLLGQRAASAPKGVEVGATINAALLDSLGPNSWRRFSVEDDERQRRIEELARHFDGRVEGLQKRFESKVEKLEQGTELPPGTLKSVKVFVAVKRRLQPGDKLAGRHGNKGVISKILPVEDMPHLEDGTPVEVILNPLGVPSRMNIGQILETHLGWAAAGSGRRVAALAAEARADSSPERIAALRGGLRSLFEGDAESSARVESLSDEGALALGESLGGGVPFATPVFDGAREADVSGLLAEAGLEESGQVTLVDGRTGEPFERKVTVGYIYILKLHHLVDDKLHARSIGPYSLVTQQPMGGKALFGGQRFGEMEVWALEAYGAAYTLQEILTVKSDDVAGRTKAYEAIIKGEDNFESGVPESFNVLVKELKSLCLNIDLQEAGE